MPDQAVAPRQDVGTHLAYDRTRLAYERTMMAWVRTSATLISFGFSIYKFSDVLAIGRPAGVRAYLIGSREYAFFMITIGVLVLLVATLQHRRDMRNLKAHHADMPTSLAGVLAGLVAVLGVVALAAVILRQ